jgi:hypothetical protein
MSQFAVLPLNDNPTIVLMFRFAACAGTVKTSIKISATINVVFFTTHHLLIYYNG